MAGTIKDSSLPKSHGKEIVPSEDTSEPKPHGKEIVAQPETTNLLTLKPNDLDKTIHVKVYRKWTTINKASVPAMHSCILLDQQGGAIQANIKPREKDRFNALEVDKAYKIKGFGFQDATGWMQTVNHPLSLAFGKYTDIQEATNADFPSHHFNFVDYIDLHSKVDKKQGLLTDYIGHVQYVTDLQQSTKPTKEVTYWRDIRIQNLDGMSVRFTLWNEKARNFNMKEYEESEKPAIIAVSSCIVKAYGALQLSSTAATHCYFNPKIPEANEIRSLYNCFLEPPKIVNVEHKQSANIEDEKQRNRVKLADLLAENPQHHQGVRFTVVATIDNISDRMPWFYTRCTTCRSKVSGTFPHGHCRQTNPNTGIDYSYCFKAFIFDDTGRIMVTCFSDEAHSMVKSCNQVIQLLEEVDPYTIPPELAALQQKTFIFQLHYGKDSTKEQRFFFLDKGWNITPTTAALTIPDIKVLPASTDDEAQATATPITTTEADLEMNIPTAIPKIEPKTTTTPVQEQIDITESSFAKPEKKKTTARRQLFQATTTDSETPSTKKSKKDD